MAAFQTWSQLLEQAQGEWSRQHGSLDSRESAHLKKESQIKIYLKIPRTSQKEQHSLTAAISHCLTTLINFTTFKLSPHFQIIIWMLNNQYQAKSPSRQGQQSCLCIPVDSGGKIHIAEPARIREHTSREHQEKHHSGKSPFTSARKCTSSFQGATPVIPVTAEQKHCLAGESPKLLYRIEAENCSSWMYLLLKI